MLGQHTKRTNNPRRINREVELDDYHVLQGVPEGSLRVSVISDNWLPQIVEHPAVVTMNRQRRANTMAVAEALVFRSEPESRTTTPGIGWLAAWCQVSKATVKRAVRFLRRTGFLGLVASGRQAMYTPRSSDVHARWGDGGPVADRAVYVLCLPMTEQELAEAGAEEAERMDCKGTLADFLNRFSRAVDIIDPPIPNTAKLAPKNKKEWAAPTLKTYFRALSERFQDQGEDRTDLQWPRHATTNAGDEATTRFNQLQAARTVIWHSFPLQKLSHEHVRRILAPAFRSGYTPDDVLHLLDYLPDGTPRPHDGFTGVRDVARILQKRLGDWKQGSAFIYSRSQRIEARRAPLREAAVAAAAAAELPLPPSRKQRGMTAMTAEGFDQGISVLRSLFTR